jgi:hypothetical protein
MSKDRAVKAVRPGVSIILDDIPHKVVKIIQGEVIASFFAHAIALIC